MIAQFNVSTRWKKEEIFCKQSMLYLQLQLLQLLKMLFQNNIELKELSLKLTIIVRRIDNYQILMGNNCLIQDNVQINDIQIILMSNSSLKVLILIYKGVQLEMIHLLKWFQLLNKKQHGQDLQTNIQETFLLNNYRFQRIQIKVSRISFKFIVMRHQRVSDKNLNNFFGYDYVRQRYKIIRTIKMRSFVKNCQVEFFIRKRR